MGAIQQALMMVSAAAGGGPSGSTTVWSATDKTSNVALSNSDRTATLPNDGQNKGVRSTTGKSTGKWYFEINADTVGDADQTYRGAKKSTGGLGLSTNEQASIAPSGSIQVGTGISNGIGTPLPHTTGDVLGFALDMTNGRLFIAKNGVYMSSGDPVAGTGGFISGLTGTWHAFTGLGDLRAQQVSTLNCGATAFTYSPPSGYTAL